MPKTRYWWSSFGEFSPLDERAHRPYPLEVLIEYLDRAQVEERKRAEALIEKGLKKTMVYELLSGEGFDSLERCRLLVDGFDIPPQLLALDGTYRGQDHWWHQFGLTFESEKDGYPNPGEVILYLRSRKSKIGKKGANQSWTQKDLATALGLTEVTVRKMENNRLPIVSMKRRELLVRVLAMGTTLPQTALICSLFGLDAQALGMGSPLSTGSASRSVTRLDVTTIEAHQEIQKALYEEYYRNHAQSLAAEVLSMLQAIDQQIAPQAQGINQQSAVLTLQSFYHQFLGEIAREQNNKRVTISHLNQGIQLAADTRRISSENPSLLGASNLLSSVAYLRRARFSFDTRDYSAAVTDIDIALKLAKSAPDNFLAKVYMEAGLMHSFSANTVTERTVALSYFDQAYPHIAPGLIQPDTYFMKANEAALYTLRGQALTAPGMTANPLPVLDQAASMIPSHLQRRRLITDIFRSQALINQGHYDEATSTLLSAIKAAQKLRSSFNKQRIEELYQRLQNTTFKSDPHLVQLGVALQMWAMEE